MKLKLSSEEDYSFLRGHLAPHSDVPRLSFERNILFEDGRTPLLSQLSIHVAAKNEAGETVFGPATQHIFPQQNEGDSTILLSPDSSAGRVIRTVAVGQSGAASLDICVTLHIPKKCFELGKFIHAAPPPPEKRGFCFAVLDDVSQHDFWLSCTNGVLPCNRAALFQTSAYFRRYFGTNPFAVSSAEDCPLEALSTVIGYMMTATFARPQLMTPKMAEEMFALVRRYRPVPARPLLAAIEESACEQLEKDQNSLEQVVRWFLAGIECEMPLLENAALAVLLIKHMNDFAMDFVVNEPGRPAWRELHERLHQRRTIFRNEPMQKILRCRRQQIEHIVRGEAS